MLHWLRRSTTNRCIDQSRRMARRTEVPLPAQFHPAVTAETSDALLSESLRRHVAALPEWQRAVVILRFQEDLDLSEIASMLRIPLNTVKSRLHRALDSLRESFERRQQRAVEA
jgi:RNA polymerase sigma-70 factor (ECF subfamily)